jgi:hypothetical protein
VGKSSVGGRVAGVGVVNRGEMIPEGVLLGPYKDNSWEIRDPFINKSVDYIDLVTKEHNLLGFQLAD